MLNETVKALENVFRNPKESIATSIRPYQGQYSSANARHSHHFLTFLKPEVTSFSAGVNVKKLLELVLDHYAQWEVQIGGIRILSGSFLSQNHTISDNYETLHKISWHGLKFCSEKVTYNLTETFKGLLTPEVQILGGHQFLEENPEITSHYLRSITDALGTKKMGSGVYAVYTKMREEKLLFLNAFYPYQLENLTRPGSAIIAIECFSHHPWSSLRRDFIGTINPQHASANSFRKKLFEEKESLNINTVDISVNGIHISPGPVEAMFQLTHFFNDKPDTSFTSNRTVFGNSLKSHLTDVQLCKLKENPHIKFAGNDLKSPLFECTEDMNSDEALKFLLKNPI